jgi:AcrR family transcriptional regulator
MPRSSREKSEDTRARIVEAAYHLFVERGYSATSMREISQRAVVTVGAIYNHFATKEAIWLEVVTTRHPYHEIFPVLRAAQGETLAEVVRSAASGLVGELLKRPDLLNLMFIEIVEFKGQHIPDLYRGIFSEMDQIDGIFQGKRGHFRDIPMPVLVRSFAGLFFSYYITGLLAKDLGGITTDEATLSKIVDLYLFGVLADDDPARNEAARSEAARIEAASTSKEAT